MSSKVPPPPAPERPAPPAPQPWSKPPHVPTPPVAPPAPVAQPAPWPATPAAPAPSAPSATSTPAPSTPAPAPATAPSEPIAPGTLEPSVIEALRSCFDPEIPLNIYDLALVYGIDVDPEGNVEVRMTLTSPTCPVAGTLPGEVQQKVAAVPGVKSAHVALVWDPPWEPSMLSEAARLQLGLP